MATQAQTKAPPAGKAGAGRPQRKAGFRDKEAPAGFGYFLEYLHSQAGSAKLASLERKVDEKIDKQTRLMRWIMGIGFTVMGACLTALLTVMPHLHSDTRQDIDKIDSRINKIDSRIDKIDSRMDKLEISIGENRKLLIQLIQNKSKR